MNKFVIKKNELKKVFQNIIKNNIKLVAPVEVDNYFFLQDVSNIDDIAFDYFNVVKPIKEHIFPIREVLFKLDQTGYASDTLPETKQQVIFGVRPCDTHSLLILDKPFTEDKYIDLYYKERRSKTTLITSACIQPENTCLCTSFPDSGPFSSKGSDVFCLQLDQDNFVIEILSEKGEKLFNNVTFDKIEITDQHNDKIKNLKENSEKKITKKLTIPQNMEKFFETDVWEKESNSCITCGICRYLSPTCYCFNITDEFDQRIRYWISCSFKNYTKMTSGEISREKKSARFKHWYYHKFCYHKQNFGEHLCVGCGRCIKYCPVKIDFTEVFSKLK